MGHRRVIATFVALLLAAGASAAGAPAARAKVPPKAKTAPPAGAAVSPPAPDAKLFGDATFLLPSTSKVGARWVLPPTEKSSGSLRLAVDPAGAPLIGIEQRLISPLRQYVVSLDAAPEGMAYLASGVLLLAKGRDLGVLAEPSVEAADEKGVPRVAFQPLVALPLRRIEVLATAGDEVLCAGFDPARGRQTVYRLRVARGAGLQELELVHESSESIAALAADEQSLYLASGRTVTRVTRRDGKGAVYYSHPSSPVKQLALTPAGLVVSTGTELVLAGQHGAIEIMRSSGHTIAARGGTLYILFDRSLGVIALDDLGDLARFDLAVRPLERDERKPELTLAALRFFEAGPPPWTAEPFADRFDRASVRRLIARIDYSAPPAKTARDHTITVTWFEPTGGQLWSAMYPATLSPRATTGTVYASIGGEPKQGYLPRHQVPGTLQWRYGPDPLGLRYPGEYRVEVEIDGVPTGAGTFALTGEPRPVDVLGYDDLPGLKRLLAGGLSPRQRIEGTPLLALAVRFGSLREVEALLDAGADPNEADEKGDPPLALPLYGLAKAEALVRHGADVNARVGDRKNPLVHAAWSADVVAFLVRKGADVRSRNAYTGEALLAKVITPSMCTEELLGLLLARGIDVNQVETTPPNYTPLGQAISFGDESCVALLLSRGASQRGVREPSRTALFVALQLPKEKKPEARRIAKLLLEQGGSLAPDERWVMFEGDNASLFDPAALAAGVLTDDNALDRASHADDPEIRELALRAHLYRVREETEAATSDAALLRAHEHCLAAFRLAEARFQRLAIDVVPAREGAQGAPMLGIELFSRPDRGTYVLRTVAGGAAAKAGLQPGDVLLSVGGAEVRTPLDVVSALAQRAPGEPVPLEILRDDPAHLPELPLSCGVLEQRIGNRELARMNLSRWLAWNGDTAQAPAIRALLGEK